MTVAIGMMAGAAMLSWLMIRRCPLARAIGLQVSQVAAQSR